jgi:hypothetical protein
VHQDESGGRLREARNREIRLLVAGLQWAAISGCLWAAVVFRWGDGVD